MSSRSHGEDRFYNPPAVRRQQQQSLPRESQRRPKSDASVDTSSPTDSEESTLSKRSTSSSSPPSPSVLSTNLDRLMESVTPAIPANLIPETSANLRRNREVGLRSFFVLDDLWESFKEWSVYGVGVPLLLNGKDSVMQYYVPSLSGIQLYIDHQNRPSRLRRSTEESEFGSSKETSSNGSSDFEAEIQAKCTVDGPSSHPNMMNLTSQQFNNLSLSDRSSTNSSSDDTHTSGSPGMLAFEYFEREQPHHRKPLADKISVIASKFPDILKYRSCDLLPSSWLSVAWYPIYRIPMGPTLQNLDASFLAFHSLSTRSKGVGKGRPVVQSLSGRKGCIGSSSKISLPVFGLASYKLKGSILTTNGEYECHQENKLLSAADGWLKKLHVDLPDFRFFISHNAQWR